MGTDDTADTPVREDKVKVPDETGVTTVVVVGCAEFTGTDMRVAPSTTIPPDDNGTVTVVGALPAGLSFTVELVDLSGGEIVKQTARP